MVKRKWGGPCCTPQTVTASPHATRAKMLRTNLEIGESTIWHMIIFNWFSILLKEKLLKNDLSQLSIMGWKNAVPAKSMVFCLWWCLSVGKVRLVAWKTWSPVASLPGHLRRKNDIYDGPQWTCCISCGSSRRQWQATPARIKPRWVGAGWWLHSGVRPHFGCSLIILLSYNFILSYIIIQYHIYQHTHQIKTYIIDYN